MNAARALLMPKVAPGVERQCGSRLRKRPARHCPQLADFIVIETILMC
jgi:hypothetical protein